MGFELKALLVCFALALGITAPLPELVGGMLVGLAATYAGFIVTPAESRLTVWATLFIGLLVCLVAAIAHPDLPFGLAELRLQLVLAGAGFVSRWIAGALASFGKGAVARAGKLPSELRLPWGKD